MSIIAFGCFPPFLLGIISISQSYSFLMLVRWVLVECASNLLQATSFGQALSQHNFFHDWLDISPPGGGPSLEDLSIVLEMTLLLRTKARIMAT